MKPTRGYSSPGCHSTFATTRRDLVDQRGAILGPPRIGSVLPDRGKTSLPAAVPLLLRKGPPRQQADPQEGTHPACREDNARQSGLFPESGRLRADCHLIATQNGEDRSRPVVTGQDRSQKCATFLKTESG
jgi:hypothetical protein